MLFCYEQFDELTLLHLREFDKKKMISVETDIVVDHYKEEKFEEHKPGLLPPSDLHVREHSRSVVVLTLLPPAASERLTQEQADDLIGWMKNALGTRVANIKVQMGGGGALEGWEVWL